MTFRQAACPRRDGNGASRRGEVKGRLDEMRYLPAVHVLLCVTALKLVHASLALVPLDLFLDLERGTLQSPITGIEHHLAFRLQLKQWHAIEHVVGHRLYAGGQQD